jgi:hypothetical protein
MQHNHLPYSVDLPFLLGLEFQVTLIDHERLEPNRDLKWDAQRGFTDRVAALLNIKATLQGSHSFGERVL